MKKVLITGCEGFIGRNLSFYLKQKDYDVFGADVIQSNNKNACQVDLLDLNSIQSLLEIIKPDVIFHCAGNASVPSSIQNPLLDLANNLNVTETLLLAMANIGLK